MYNGLYFSALNFCFSSLALPELCQGLIFTCCSVARRYNQGLVGIPTLSLHSSIQLGIIPIAQHLKLYVLQSINFVEGVCPGWNVRGTYVRIVIITWVIASLLVLYFSSSCEIQCVVAATFS